MMQKKYQQNHGANHNIGEWWEQYPALFEEVKSTLAENRGLRIYDQYQKPYIRGLYYVVVNGVEIDYFNLRIDFPDKYPNDLPVIKMLGSRIPNEPDRHINHDGTACLYEPMEWLLSRPDKTFRTWLNVAVYNFCLAQLHFEEFGFFEEERSHGVHGIIEAYKHILGIQTDDNNAIFKWLRVLSREKIKGHWACPCGSGGIIRKCCHNQITCIAMKFSHLTVKAMIWNIIQYSSLRDLNSCYTCPYGHRWTESLCNHLRTSYFLLYQI